MFMEILTIMYSFHSGSLQQQDLFELDYDGCLTDQNYSKHCKIFLDKTIIRQIIVSREHVWFGSQLAFLNPQKLLPEFRECHKIYLNPWAKNSSSIFDQH